MRDAARRARTEHPSRVSVASYGIAGRTVTVRMAGEQLGATLPRAISHLALVDDPAQPDLLIEAWDEGDTGVGAPDCVPGSEPGAPGTTTASADGRYVLFEQARTRSVLDRAAQHIVTWVSSTADLSQYELGRPWHSELLLWQRDRGLQPLHAGFIECHGHGVLLGGPGGSGKSTTSLACMQDGWAYLADDYVAVRHEPGQPIIGYGAYNSAHLDPRHLLRFPALVRGAIPGRLAREDKSLVLLSDLAAARLAGSAEIRVLAFPRVVDRPASSFRPASRAEALLRLAPSSLLLLPYAGLGHTAFESLSALVDALPTYWFDVGRDLNGVAPAMGALLEEVVD
jgi:hypothetical protein